MNRGWHATSARPGEGAAAAHRWRSLRPVALLLLVASVPPAARADQAAPAERLRQVEDERGKIELFLRQVDDRQATALATLDELDRRAEEAATDAATAAREAAFARAALERARAEEADILERRQRLAARLGPRLLLRYRLRETGYLRALLSAPTIGDYLWRRRMLDRILGKDLELAKALATAQAGAQAARERVARAQADDEQAEQVALARAAEARRRRGIEQGVLKAVLARRRSYERVVAGLKRAQRRLLEAIAQLPPTPEGLGGFGAEEGTLPMPVTGAIVVPFGRHVDPKFGTVLDQKGVDIRAAMGAPVHAPYAAIVGYAGWFRGYGNLIVLDHGEGYYTLYGHLATLNVGQGDRVQAGDIIGTVGDTGSLQGPDLYFAIRSGTEALDPGRWLAP